VRVTPLNRTVKNIDENEVPRLYRILLSFLEERWRGDEHDMELSRLSSILAMVGAVNIFYAMYGLAQMDWVNTLLPLGTYLILIYSSAIVDGKSRELAREREIVKSTSHEEYQR